MKSIWKKNCRHTRGVHENRRARKSGLLCTKKKQIDAGNRQFLGGGKLLLNQRVRLCGKEIRKGNAKTLQPGITGPLVLFWGRRRVGKSAIVHLHPRKVGPGKGTMNFHIETFTPVAAKIKQAGKGLPSERFEKEPIKRNGAGTIRPEKSRRRVKGWENSKYVGVQWVSKDEANQCMKKDKSRARYVGKIGEF